MRIRCLVLALVVFALSGRSFVAGQSIDIVGGASTTANNAAKAKGNSYLVNLPIVYLQQMEFWLNFSGPQALTFYVFTSPIEFGTYNQVFTTTLNVTGTGAAWYACPTPTLPLTATNHYILALSWPGSLSYYYSTGDMQATSFGAHTHGYAVGNHPLPTAISSTVNDQAIYYQRITTIVNNILVVSQTGPGIGDLNVALNFISPTAAEGWTLLSGNVSASPNSGPFLGLTPDGLTWSIFTYPYFPGNPFHFHTSDPGVYPSAPFVAPPGTVSSLTGFNLDFAVLLLNSSGGYDSVSSAVRYLFQ